MMREFSGAKEKMIKSIPTQVGIKVLKREKNAKKMNRSKEDQKHSHTSGKCRRSTVKGMIVF
jgi:hypothetical protein